MASLEECCPTSALKDNAKKLAAVNANIASDEKQKKGYENDLKIVKARIIGVKGITRSHEDTARDKAASLELVKKINSLQDSINRYNTERSNYIALGRVLNSDYETCKKERWNTTESCRNPNLQQSCCESIPRDYGDYIHTIMTGTISTTSTGSTGSTGSKPTTSSYASQDPIPSKPPPKPPTTPPPDQIKQSTQPGGGPTVQEANEAGAYPNQAGPTGNIPETLEEYQARKLAEQYRNENRLMLDLDARHRSLRELMLQEKARDELKRFTESNGPPSSPLESANRQPHTIFLGKTEVAKGDDNSGGQQTNLDQTSSDQASNPDNQGVYAQQSSQSSQSSQSNLLRQLLG